MKTGDIVRYYPEYGRVLCHGKEVIDRAVIASMDPFVLVAEYDDIVWTDLENEGFQVIGAAPPTMLHRVMSCLARRMVKCQDKLRRIKKSSLLMG